MDPFFAGGPDWTPITPKTGSLFHADQHMGNFEDAVIWLTDFSGSHLGPLLGAFGGERSAIRTEDAKFFHASFQDREVRISGERTIFEGVEVSGAQIRYYRREPDEKPRGWVWARADNPAQHIPGTLLYFECDPAGVTEAVDGSGRNAGFLLPQVEQRVGRYRGALPERTTYPPISYLEYAMGYVAIVPSRAECVLKPAPKSNDGGATLMSTGTP